jgi:hypothetical protein
MTPSSDDEEPTDASSCCEEEVNSNTIELSHSPFTAFEELPKATTAHCVSPVSECVESNCR